MNKPIIYINKATLESYTIQTFTKRVYWEGFKEANQEFYNKYWVLLDTPSPVTLSKEVIREWWKLLDKYITWKEEYHIISIYPIDWDLKEIDAREYTVEFY